jgi:hypothetical protein
MLVLSLVEVWAADSKLPSIVKVTTRTRPHVTAHTFVATLCHGESCLTTRVKTWTGPVVSQSQRAVSKGRLLAHDDEDGKRS